MAGTARREGSGMNLLAAWLTAQVDADEAVARANVDGGLRDSDPAADGVGWPDYETYSGTPELALAQDYLDRFRPRRTLAEVSFKRTLLISELPGWVLVEMARMYEDRPGYPEALR